MSLRKDTYVSSGEKTFEFDEGLPVLPVPDLNSTLEKYIESVIPHVTETELANTVKAVKKFGSGIGKELHEKLLLKAKKEKNWVEEWWERYAYLRLREPLVPYYSMAGVNNWNDSPVPLSYEKSLTHAALYCYHLVEFWKLIREQRLKPNQNAEKQYFSMKSFRNIFNSARHPGVSEDALKSYFKTEEEGPCPSHVVVLVQGRIFIFDTLDSTGLPITPLEWESYFKQILCICEEKGPGSGIALLTSANRSQWAKNRQWLEALSRKNAENLHLVDSALFAVVLDKECPESESAIARNVLCGDFSNRWIDKSLNMIFFKNSVLGTLCDHAQFDGMVSIQTFHYVYLALSETKGNWIGSKKVRDFPPPEEVCFDLDPIIQQELLTAGSSPPDLNFTPVIARENFTYYGKDFISKQKLHPDSFVQMALQLAYYRLHRKPAPTYETATTRIFYNGRTETVRACTVEAMTWVYSMLDKKHTDIERKELLKKAINKHNLLMKQGKINAGCDRHLFGLQCIAMENGIELPEIFKDPAWIKSGGGGNFMLSTSLVGYFPMGGCVAPMCLDGYGCFYNICPKSIHFSISAWRGSNESSSHKFANAIEQSLLDMKKIFINDYSKL